MRYWFVVIGTLIFMIAALMAAIFWRHDIVEPIVQRSFIHEQVPQIGDHPMFFEKRNFFSAIDSAEHTQPRDDIRAVIVPQHLHASTLIARQLKRASGREVSTVVIVGPNHYNDGADIVASTAAEWMTPEGVLSSNTLLTSNFIRDMGGLGDAEVFQDEHAVGAVAPFVKHYYPDATLLPIAFNSYARLDDVRRVSEWLVKHLPEDSLIVYSIDFSHYLTRQDADMFDEETATYLRNQHVEKIMTLGNSYLDSPASLATAIQMQQAYAWNQQILSITNSDDYAVVRTPETTSYFEVIYTDRSVEVSANDNEVLLSFVGDIMLSRDVAHQMSRRGDWAYPFLLIGDELRKSDILFGNLEGPISDRGKNQGSIYSFRADPKSIDGLVFAGFDVLSVANNHMGDWSFEAADQTFTLLADAGIGVAGGGKNGMLAHAPYVKQLKGTRFAYLAYTVLGPPSIHATDQQAGITAYSDEQMQKDIAAAQKISDVIVVSIHFGEEYQKQPSNQQRRIAQLAIDSGASIVAGHHPHVVQPVEQYKDGYIAYSLGNFVFDQSFSDETMMGMLLEVRMKGSQIVSVTERPTYLNRSYQVSFEDIR